MLKQAPPRYCTAAARVHLDALLQLSSRDGMQDWPLEVSDDTRIAEFCDLYESDQIDNEVRFPLMELLLFSLEISDHDLTATEDTDAMIYRIACLLRRDFPLHIHTLNYWRQSDLLDDPDPEHISPITPLARRIWEECFLPEYWDDLITLFHREPRENIWERYWLMELIAESRSPELFDFFMRYLYGDEPYVRYMAMWGLKRLGTKAARRALWEARTHTFPDSKENVEFQQALSEIFQEG